MHGDGVHITTFSPLSAASFTALSIQAKSNFPSSGSSRRPSELAVVDEIESQLRHPLDVAFPLVFRPVFGIIIHAEVRAFFREEPSLVRTGWQHTSHKQQAQARQQFFHGWSGSLHLVMPGEIRKCIGRKKPIGDKEASGDIIGYSNL